jgi:hypothetical protein
MQVLTGVSPVGAGVGVNQVGVGAIQALVSQFMAMELIIIPIILAEEVLLILMECMAIIDILKVLLIQIEEEQIILIMEEVPITMIPETVLHS